jgi:hypothetical protein
MKSASVLEKVLRPLVVIFMGIAAAMNILGGIGTMCVAFFTKNYPSLRELWDYQWLYQALTVVTVGIGVACVWSVMELARGWKHAHRNASILLSLGVIVSGVHVCASLALRGEAVPANIKFYANVAALLLLMIKLPGARQRVEISKPEPDADQATNGGLAALVIGLVVHTTELWVGRSHVFQGQNWVRVLHAPLVLAGALLTLGGLVLLLRGALHAPFAWLRSIRV